MDDLAHVELLRTFNWRSIIVDVESYIHKRVGLYSMPAGYTIDDIRQAAFERLLKGKAGIPDSEGMTTAFLKKNVESLLSSHGLYERKKDIPLAETDVDTKVDKIPEKGWLGMPPTDVALAWKLLDEEIDGDEELGNVVAAIKLGGSKPSEIAELTGYDVERVYLLQPKLALRVSRACERFRGIESGEEKLS